MAHFPMFRASWDLDFIEDSRTFAVADFDHDGRQEVVSEESQRSAVALA